MGNPADPKRKNISFVNDDCFQGAGAGEKRKQGLPAPIPLVSLTQAVPSLIGF